MLRESIVILLVAILLLPACRDLSSPVTGLSEEDWAVVRANLLDEIPEIEHYVGTVFAGKVELIGFDLDPDIGVAGDDLTVTWYWRVLEEFDDDWRIFVHLHTTDNEATIDQNLDHDSIGDRYPAALWEVGQIIRDRQVVTLDPQIFGNSTVSMHVGFWRLSDDARLEVSRSGLGVVDSGGRVLAGEFRTQIPIETYAARRIRETIEIDGLLNERDWRTAEQTSTFVHPNTGVRPDRALTHARILWDEDALYIGVIAADDELNAEIEEDDGNLWEEDSIEVHLDPVGDGRNYLVVQVNPLGAVFDALFERSDRRSLDAVEERIFDVEGLQAAVHTDERGESNRWTVKLRLPWASIPDFGDVAEEGMSIRANFFRHEDSVDGDALAWRPVRGGSFHRPEHYGAIRLVGPAEDEAEDEGDDEGDDEERPRLLEIGTPLRLPSQALPARLAPVGTAVRP